MNLLDDALRYQSIGWFVLPVDKGTKSALNANKNEGTFKIY